MTNRVCLSLLLLVAAPLSVIQASQARKPGVQDTPASAPGRHPCFAQYLRDLVSCGEEFCPNDVTCNEDLLEACIDGAKAAFMACMHPRR